MPAIYNNMEKLLRNPPKKAPIYLDTDTKTCRRRWAQWCPIIRSLSYNRRTISISIRGRTRDRELARVCNISQIQSE